MVWTPFGKSSTSTSQETSTFSPTPYLHTQSTPYGVSGVQTPPPMSPKPEETSKLDDAWNPEEFEGQLAVDVFQTNTDIVIKAPIAGVSPENIDIAINDDVVTIKGTRTKTHGVSDNDYYCQECYYGMFSRSIILPVEVNTDKADATFVNGILTITIPKNDAVKTRKVEIKSF